MLVSSKRIVLLATVAISPFLTTPAYAQAAFDLGEIIVSGSLSPIATGNTGATVEVLTGNDVGADDSSIIRRLDRLPGVTSTSDGGPGQSSGIQIRGLPARYVAVRINGIDVADPSGPQSQYNFGGLTASGISRIEVLKGSQSALYGSEAIAGVVDIQTFRPETLGFSSEMATEAGSFGTYSGTLSLGYKTATSEVAFTYGRTTTNGISAKDDNTEKDGFNQTTATLTAQHQVNDNLSFGASLFLRKGSVDFDGFGTINDYALNEERGARVFAELQTGIVKHTFSYSHFDISRKYPLGYVVNYNGDRKQLAYLGSAELSPVYTLNFGIDRTEESFSDDTIASSEKTLTAQAELLVRPSDAVDLSAAVRYDDNNVFGGKTSGRLAAAWRPSADLTLRAVLGTGYRNPSLYERFGPFGLATLKPEKSRSFELGAEKTLGDRGFVKATLFFSEIDDLIDYDFTAVGCTFGPGCYTQVAGKTKSKGIELSGDYAINDTVKVYGNYTYTDARTKGVRLARAPRHDLVIGASSAFTDKFSGYMDLRHVAGVVPAPGNPKVRDYTLVGLGVNYDITDKATAYLRVENLFDKDYQTVGGYNMPGRAAFVGIRAKF
ncbi:TonB-dependent siderophore receptor [Pseudorhodobacter sp.]|uniref:TonB-dependent receptor plug domain-containing protein n=1 Tax=Pseudorhodobacter sp. TaxID=1934400 RepID=UPI0026484038|nr:TonB-dependent receptor [Pseudorhodobacter sp.]MDN5785806.1 TonB-dependent receptor [Pseudorhodobacter sp.]